MKTPKNAVKAEINTVNSNMIGKKGGTVKKFTGLPCTINGKRKDDGMNSSKAAVVKPEEPAAKNDVSQRGFPESHRLVHSMDRKRRMNIPELKSGVPDFLCGLKKSRCTREFRDDRKRRFCESGSTHA